MKTTVATFTFQKDAFTAIEQLRNLEFNDEEISTLSPRASKSDIEEVPTTETERPGVGKAIGGVVGGAVGAAGGLLIGSAVSTLVFPGLGPVMVTGFVATLGGIGGAAGEYLPDGLIETAGDAIGVIERHVETDLKNSRNS